MHEQLLINGESKILIPDGVMVVTRRVMHEKPVTYKSHRLLMIEIAKSWGFKWDSLEREQKYALERLFDVSPDIERCARKVREEDSLASKSSLPLPIKSPEPYIDPFDAVENDMKRIGRWRR